MTIPDSLPILTRGLGNAAAGRACAMSAVHFLEGGKGNSDAPECVHPVLRSAFVRVNDAPIWRDDEHRTRTLWPLIVRAMGTRPPPDEHAAKVLNVRLAVWCAWQVLPLVRVRDRDVCEAAITAAEGWCAGTITESECAAAASASYAAAAAASYAAAAAASYAAAASVSLALLTGLLDEHARLTGHTAAPVGIAPLAALVPSL